MRLQQKWIPVLRDHAARKASAHDRHLTCTRRTSIRRTPEVRAFMPRDSDKHNDSRDRPPGGKGRSGRARGPEKKFAKRGLAGKDEGEKRPYAGKRERAKPYGNKPYSGSGKPYAGQRDGASSRLDRDDARPAARFSEKKLGDKRPYTPRGEGFRNQDDRPKR